MLKYSEDKMAETAMKYNELNTRKKRIENESKSLADDLRKGMAEHKLSKGWFGDFEVTITEVSPSPVADVDKMKADGIFTKYSKMKNGYSTLSVKYSKAPEDGLPF